MSIKMAEFIAMLATVGQGNPLTVAIVSKRLSIHRDTAQRYLSEATAKGYLIAEERMYRPHIPQTVYWRKDNA